MSSLVVALVVAASVLRCGRSSCGWTAGKADGVGSAAEGRVPGAAGEVAAGTGGEQEGVWRTRDMRLQVFPQYCNDRGREGDSAMASDGLRLADDPSPPTRRTERSFR
jgi:hypothetical protein